MLNFHILLAVDMDMRGVLCVCCVFVWVVTDDYIATQYLQNGVDSLDIQELHERCIDK